MSNNGQTRVMYFGYNQLGMNDVPRVGGKNASLGEMITNLSGLGVSVPNGFATTAQVLMTFLSKVASTSAFMSCWIKRMLTMSTSWRKPVHRSAHG